MRTPTGTGALAAAFIAGAVIASAATAGAAGLITGRQIRDGSVGLRDLSPAVRARLAAAGPTGPAGPKGDTGPRGATGATGATGANATDLWAVVEATGTIAASSGVESVDSSLVPGIHRVRFTRSVADCAVQVTTEGRDLLPRFAVVQARHVSPPTDVSVQMLGIDGSPTTLSNAGFRFSITAFC